MARRAAGARAFTAWAHRSGRMPADPGLRLRSPRLARTLPHVLTPGPGRWAAGRRRRTGGPRRRGAGRQRPRPAAVALRDLAVVELLYATGIRVGELVGARRRRRRPRAAGCCGCCGKGDKERVVPLRRAGRQRARGVAARRPAACWLAPTSGDRPCSSGRAAGGSTRARSGAVGAPSSSAARRRRSRPRPARPAPLGRHPPAGGGSGPDVAFRSCSVTLRSRRPRSTPTSPSSG